MWCVLAHCLRLEGLNNAPAVKGHKLLGLLLLPQDDPSWTPPVVDFSDLPTDRPVGFDNIKAFKLRNAGRVKVSSSCGCGRTVPRHGRRPAHRAASAAQRPLQPIHNFRQEHEFVDRRRPGSTRAVCPVPVVPVHRLPERVLQRLLRLLHDRSQECGPGVRPPSASTPASCCSRPCP